MSSKFKINDTVEWTSSSGGYEKTKIGKIVAVVLPEQSPRDAWRKIPEAARKGMSRMEWGYSRGHESYLVAVQTGETTRAKLRVYWPRVPALKGGEAMTRRQRALEEE